MPRTARIVACGLPHHVTQRGNRRCDIFFDTADRQKYLALLADYAGRYGLAVRAFCLMTNPVHLIAVPAGPQSLALTMRDTHQAYAAWLNRKTGQSGHLWQGRFFSCVLDPDDSHYWSAVRYVERNPVRAGLVQRAWEYPWSSAAVHCGRRPDKRLGEAGAALISGDLEQADEVGDWRAFLRDEDDDPQVEQLRQRTRTGRPLGDAGFLDRLGTMLGRPLHRQKPGPKPKKKGRKA